MSKIDLYKGDCLEIMDKLIKEGIKVDLILTDPPYGTTACKWDSIIPFEPMWERLKLLRKDNSAIVLFGSEPFSSALRMSKIKEYKYDWVWNKKKGGNIMNLKHQPYKIHENVSVFFKHRYFPIMETQKERKSKTYSKGEANGIQNYGDERVYNQKFPKSIIEYSNAIQKGKVHPTQKPVDLLEYLIKTYTNERETVLDFTMGSCSTGVACINTNRNFIGIELDDTYFDISVDRVKKYIENNDLDVEISITK